MDIAKVFDVTIEELFWLYTQGPKSKFRFQTIGAASIRSILVFENNELHKKSTVRLTFCKSDSALSV